MREANLLSAAAARPLGMENCDKSRAGLLLLSLHQAAEC